MGVEVVCGVVRHSYWVRFLHSAGATVEQVVFLFLRFVLGM